MFDITDKKIIITGATGVLGEAMAFHLAKEGANVLIIGRTASKVEKLLLPSQSSTVSFSLINGLGSTIISN